MNKKKILLIDANNMFFRCYTANPGLNSNGEHIGGIIGFFYSLQKSIKDIKPHQVFIIWDGRGGSKKRREIRSDYKDGRKPPRPLRFNRAHDLQKEPEDEKISLYYQQQRVIEILNHLPFLQICEEGVEADDLISFLNSYFECGENIKIIISNDRDFIQLTNECTILYRPATKEFITYKSFVESEGVHPVNMALARAIEGDNADNLSGVGGVGRKTLIKNFPQLADSKHLTLNEFKELCELKDNNASKKILKDFETVELNYKVMQLYMPLINPLISERVINQIQDFQYPINPAPFREEFKKDLIIGASLNALIEHGRAIVRENKK